MGWKLLIDKANSGAMNMAADRRLFDEFEAGNDQPVLRIYAWRPKCVSLGRAQKLNEIDQSAAESRGWDIVRRPTGGGIVFHNEAEVTYSLVMAKDDPFLPKGLVPAYMKISEALVAGLTVLGVKAEISRKDSVSRPTGLCFSYPAEYEVVVGGKKIIGSAQKRGKKALLQQGSIFVRPVPLEEYSILKEATDEPAAVSVEELLGREVGFGETAEALAEGFRQAFNSPF